MNISKFKVMNLFNIVLLITAAIQYFLLAPLNSPHETYINTVMELDHKIKLIPGFIIPYLSVYILFFLMIFLIARKKDSSDLTIFLMSVVFLWSLINFLHGILPTENIIRPEVKEQGFFFEAINNLYTTVKPFRTLPSWHAATAVLCAIAFIKLKFSKKIPLIVWSVLILFSPLFLKMSYIIDAAVAIPLAFLSYFLVEKISTVKIKTESVQEIVKAFTLESLVQSVAIGIRDESTLNSLIEGLTRIEKNLSQKDRDELKKIGAELHPPVDNLKELINKMILSIDLDRHLEKAREMFGNSEKSYVPSDRDLKQATEELINEACRPLDNPKFRFALLEIKKRNTLIMNTSSIEESAKERSHDIIFRFKSFIESYKSNIPVLKSIAGNSNGHEKLNYDDIKLITRELRKPPYEISADEIWNAFYRVDSSRVKPLGEQKNAANIISLAQFALGKIDSLEPFSDKVDKKFNEWIAENKSTGRIFTEEEMVWLNMMKNHFASFLEINMTSFNQPPFINRGGTSKVYNIFGHDLNRILYELNERLI